MTGWRALLDDSPLDPAERAIATTRAEAIAAATPLDADDLRGWHFVATGALLLHESPYGREVMHGRYAYVHDDPAACRAALVRARAVAEAWALPIERIYAPPDRASAIVAWAASAVFGCQAARWPDDDPRPGLIVVYDLARLAPATLATLGSYHPRLPLFALTASWTDPPPLGPDLVGSLHQLRRAPWDGGQGLDATTGQPLAVPPDERPIAELARQIAEAPLEADALDDLPASLAVARTIRGLAAPATAGCERTAGPRQPPPTWSPVVSARFP